MYKLYVRDQYLDRVAEIDDYQSLEMVMRFNNPGTWVLELPSDSIAAREIIQNRAGIIIERNGSIIFSGPVAGKNRKWDKNGDRITVNGFDDTVWLARNLAYPVPSGPPYTSQAYDKRTGKAETIMKQYVDANIGTSARSDRKVTRLVMEADKGIGKSVTGNARFQTLLELNTKLALAGGWLGYRIIQVNRNLEFQVYDPVDKTKEVIFSPLYGNLLNFEYSLEDPETNYVIVGGSGEGTARIFKEKGHSASISKYGRIETFVDSRDTTDTTELIQRLDEELDEKAAKTGLSISPIDIEGCSFGTDYNLGDKVSVMLIDGTKKLEQIQDIIREIRITLNQDGETILPTIGTPDSLSHPIYGIFNKMKKFSKRLSNLERR